MIENPEEKHITRSVPERVSRKQAEICAPIVSEIFQASTRGIPADRALSALYGRHREFGSRDRRFLSNTVFSCFRWRGWLPDKDNENISATSCVLASLLDATEIHPAIGIMLEQSGLTGAHPLGTMNLAEKASETGKLLNLQQPPSCLDLVPSWFSDELNYPEGVGKTKHLETCIAILQSRQPTWLRFKTTSGDALQTLIKNSPAQLTPCPAIPNAIAAETNIDISALPTPVRGNVEIQDLASQCVSIIAAPHPRQTWWDVCAGSGGKTLHMADLMRDKGAILATDNRENIIGELRKRVKRSGFRSITPKRWNPEEFQAPETVFNGVLVDAPCTGSGTWHRNPDARWRTPHGSIEKNSILQQKLLNTASSQVRQNGFLIYAVCSIMRRETEDVIENFLTNHKNFTLSETNHPLTGETTPGKLWIDPGQNRCNGMFIAKIRKN